MTSLHFVVHPLPGTEDQLNERLKAISDKLNRFGSAGPSALNNLRVPVKAIVVGPTHFALLLEDGRICRVNFSIITDRLDLTKNESTKKTNTGSGGGARQPTRARARIMRTTTLRGSRTSTGNSIQIGRPIVPAPYVPEELVAHAQVVLQGKSRNLIIRELQRTNLDVNLAVNNLLSRDEEEADDTEDAQDSYVPEDLISLLDGGFHDQHSVIIDADTMFSEDMFGYSTIRRGGSSARRQASNMDRDREPEEGSRRQTDRDSFNRWRDRQYFGPRKWLESALRDPTWEKDPDSKKKELAQQSPLWTSDELEFWPDTNVRFTMIAALHSELIAVSTNGQLYQWRWCDPEPYKHPDNPFIHHPKTMQLGLLTEKIIIISGTIIRASAVTESNKVCTWVDESLTPIASKLEHPLQTFFEFGSERILSLHTCALYTLVRLENGALYWWGVLPFAQRRKLWEKFRAKSRKHRPTSSSQDIIVGSQVCMKNSPMCQPGALGFTISCGVPKVGQLQNAAWNLTDTCRFKLLSTVAEPTKSSSLSQIGIATTLGGNLPAKSASTKETADSLNMPPPPSPASSTCSDTGSTSHKRAKRPQSKSTEPEERKDEEEWPIKNVIFMEDSCKSVPVGRVLKVDGAYAAVKFPTVKEPGNNKEGNTNKSAEDDGMSLLNDCRLVRVEDLQVLKSNTTSRAPDCFQRIPKKVNVPEVGGIIALAVDTQGIHAIVKNNTKLSYIIYNLSSGRVEQESVFPSDCIPSFTGIQSNNINLTCTGEGNEGVVLVRDSNSTIFPLAKDCLDSIRDPQWLDLPPVRCLGAGTHALSGLSNKNMKNQVAVIVMALENQLLMSKILRCDLEGIKNVLAQLEAEVKSGVVGVHSSLANVLAERCDGNRNIFHACVTMCVPTGNKEPEDNSTASTNPLPPASSGLDSMNVIRNLTSRSQNLREMMQRATAVMRSALPSSGPSGSGSNTASAGSSRTEGGNEAGSGEPAGTVEEPIPTLAWPPDPLSHSGDEDSFMDLASSGNGTTGKQTASAAGCSSSGSGSASGSGSSGKYILDLAERKANALAALRLLCDSPALQVHLLDLLSAKDSQGLTPFMMSVTLRAYPAAVVLLECIQIVASKQQEADVKNAMNAMIYPPGSNPDNNPLHVLCCNDTCSFTWTGAEHINQDIFECRTCGLTGSLCCCTECARVCHKGHDCKLKKTSPTAYCDCWEKCKCKALIMGAQVARFQLLSHLVLNTDLVIYPNSRGENLLLFLVQTVGRQSVEQRQYRSSSRPRSTSNNSSSRKTPSSDVEVEMPEHDLEPPRFTRRALERLLNDWQGVRAMLMSGVKVTPTLGGGVAYLQSQSGTTLLDKFTHCLIVKCSIEMLDTLMTTLIRELQNDNEPGRAADARTVARRFIRSIARIFVIFSIETIPTSSKKRGLSSHSQHILKCRRAFQALIKLAIEELCEIADSLIAPVRLGVVRPTAPFTLASNSLDVISGSEELFAVEPMAFNSDLQGDSATNGIPSSHHTQPASTVSQQPQNSANLELDEVDASEAMVVDDDTSEQEDNAERSQDRAEPMESEQHELTGNQIEDGDQRDDQSDTTELDLLAESESESDDNQDPASAQGRSEQITANVGSDTDEDSGESSQQEEEESEAGETDEHDPAEELPLQDEQLERRVGSTLGGGSRSNLAPHSMQWAIRSREPRGSGSSVGTGGGGVGGSITGGARSTGTSGGVRMTGGGNSLVFIDPTSLRRSGGGTNGGTGAGGGVVPSSAQVACEPVTMATTASVLARAFAIVVRQIADLLTMLQDYHTLGPMLPRTLEVTNQESINIQLYLEYHLKPTWDWLLTVMDSTEAQLRFGASLTHTSDAAQSVSNRSNETRSRHPPNISRFSFDTSNNSFRIFSRDRDSEVLSGIGGSARRELLSYCLSLMRAHNSEHLDSLPVLDVSALKHIAYVLDALIYYMRSGYNQDADISAAKAFSLVDAWTVDQDENENDENEDEVNRAVCGLSSDSYDDDNMSSRGRKHPFLQRSDSTLCLGCPPPDPFELPLVEALPLADQPQLLQPNARREDLFGMPKQPITVPATGTNAPGTYNPLESLPTRLGLSIRTADTTTATGAPVMTSVPSTHLTPCAFNASVEKTRTMVTGGAASAIAASHSPQPNTSSAHKSNFLEMYNDLIQDMEEPPSVVEEPQDLSLHQLTHDSEKMDVDFSDEYSDSDYEASRSSVAGTTKTGHEGATKEEEEAKVREQDDGSKQSEPVPESESGETSDAGKEKKSSSPTLAAQSLLNLARRFPRTSPHRPASPTPDRAPIIVTRKNLSNAIALAMEASNAQAKTPTPQNISKEDLKLANLNLTGLVAPSSASATEQPSGSGVKSVIVRAGSSLQNTLGGDAPDVLVVDRTDNNGESTSEIVDVSTQVTVETTPATPIHRPQPSIGQSVSHDLLLGRWRLSLDLFGRVFMEDVGLEPGSVVAELGGFPVKEAKFRREMERIRNAQQRDLNLSKMERDRTQLIIATFKELNTLYCNSHRRNNIQGALAVSRVKVTFKDEPGEGSGVARSFYTAIAEALLANEKLPNLDAAQVPSERGRGGNEAGQVRSSPRSSTAPIMRVQDPRSRNRGLSIDARVFKPASSGNEPSQPSRNEHLTPSQRQMGDKLYPKVYAQRPAYAGKITGMLLELSSAQVLMLMASEETLKHKIEQAYEMILNLGEDGSNAHLEMDGFSGDKKTGNGECDMLDAPEDNSPLFYAPGKRGFYSPRQGRSTYQRLNAFRNVGRLIGLCLLQNELCPIFLNRHVLKYILGRMIRFHDLAFFDPVIYESLRELVLDAERKDGAHILETLDLTFSIDLSVEEGGGSMELVPGGREVPVTVHNVYDYVRKYAQARMIKTQEKALLAMRTGVFDVLPNGALEGLMAEDLRLLLNGVGDINVQVLISYTSFNDESGESSDRLVKFKRWLWSIVDKMTHLERQDLVYFWTGSPALPASEDGFQPMPSVTIRPADDAHLPTANTCISRLYIPLYSCRQVSDLQPVPREKRQVITVIIGTILAIIIKAFSLLKQWLGIRLENLEYFLLGLRRFIFNDLQVPSPTEDVLEELPSFWERIKGFFYKFLKLGKKHALPEYDWRNVIERTLSLFTRKLDPTNDLRGNLLAGLEIGSDFNVSPRPPSYYNTVAPSKFDPPMTANKYKLSAFEMSRHPPNNAGG